MRPYASLLSETKGKNSDAFHDNRTFDLLVMRRPALSKQPRSCARREIAVGRRLRERTLNGEPVVPLFQVDRRQSQWSGQQQRS